VIDHLHRAREALELDSELYLRFQGVCEAMAKHVRRLEWSCKVQGDEVWPRRLVVALRGADFETVANLVDPRAVSLPDRWGFDPESARQILVGYAEAAGDEVLKLYFTLPFALLDSMLPALSRCAPALAAAMPPAGHHFLLAFELGTHVQPRLYLFYEKADFRRPPVASWFRKHTSRAAVVLLRTHPRGGIALKPGGAMLALGFRPAGVSEPDLALRYSPWLPLVQRAEPFAAKVGVSRRDLTWINAALEDLDAPETFNLYFRLYDS